MIRRQPIRDPRSRPPLARMLQIHDRLKQQRWPNCTQLAEELEVATKTIQRDIDFMRDRLNLPIEFDFPRNGFHYTEPVENFPTVQVTEQELFALFVAEKALRQYRGTPFEQPLQAAFGKLTAGLSDSVSFRWSEMEAAISFRSLGSTVADLELFETLSRAVLRSQELQLAYHKLAGKGYEQRRVQPWHVGNIDGQWYLFGFDLDREQLRTFAVARMKEVRPTGKRFTRPADFSIAKHLGASFGVFSADRKPEQVRIRFDTFAARLVRERRWHDSQKITERRDGTLDLALRLGNLTEIHRWILSWGEHARVLAPARLRDQVRASAARILEQNQTAPD